MRRVLGTALVVLAAPALFPVGTFAVVPDAGRVEVVVRDNRGGFVGVTERVEGTVVVRQGEADQYEATVEARVDARTLATGVGLRDAQMRRDFLQTDRFPFVTFRGRATAREHVVAGPMRVPVRGTLTIRDVGREVEIPAEVVALADEYRVAGEVTIRLSAFGIPVPRFLVFVAEDPVTIRLRLRLRRVP